MLVVWKMFYDIRNGLTAVRLLLSLDYNAANKDRSTRPIKVTSRGWRVEAQKKLMFVCPHASWLNLARMGSI